MKTGLILILFVTPFVVIGQSKSSVQKQVRDSVRALMKRRDIPGLAVAVSVEGKIVWSEGFGYADLEQKVSVNPSKTKFRLGSISKSITAAGLARLYEQKKIILDSSIYFYLPDYPRYKYRPTVRQVAGHIAGIRHYKGSEFFIAEHYPNVSSALSVFKSDSLLFEPGTRYQYSSYGFNLLSATMEKAAGEEFLSFINREVIQALQLRNTTLDLNDSIIEYRSRFYEFRNNHWVNTPYVDNSYKWAGGGFISSAEDIANFAGALLRDDFLKRETIQLFITPQKLKNGSPTTYGMGFFYGKDNKQVTFFGHSGGAVGGTSDMVIYPDDKIIVVILTNLSNARLDNMASRIAHLYRKPH